MPIVWLPQLKDLMYSWPDGHHYMVHMGLLGHRDTYMSKQRHISQNKEGRPMTIHHDTMYEVARAMHGASGPGPIHIQVTRGKGHIHRESSTVTINTQGDEIHNISTGPDTDTPAAEAKLLQGPRVGARREYLPPHSF